MLPSGVVTFLAPRRDVLSMQKAVRTYDEVPDPYEPVPGDPPAVFLTGGITGAEDWQRRATPVLRTP
jgi:hypothetical protein